VILHGDASQIASVPLHGLHRGLRLSLGVAPLYGRAIILAGLSPALLAIPHYLAGHARAAIPVRSG
jgi:hypothetical protein